MRNIIAMGQPHPLLELLAAAAPSPDDLKKALSPYGFDDVKGAWASLRTLTGDPHVADAFSTLFDPLFDLFPRSPDPDMALRNLSRFSEAALDRRFLLSLLKDNPALLGLLIRIFGHSQYLSDILVRDPEYLDWIIETGLPPRGKDDLLADLTETVGVYKTKEKKLNALRRFKRRETLRIGTRDILGLSDVEGITAEISWLAEACLQAALEACRADLVRKHGAPMTRGNSEAGFVIIGMGKLGGEELNFSSDIDLLFVYEDEGDTSGPARVPNNIFFTRLGEDILKAVSGMTDEGYCYRVDMRLRPEGRSGPLVRCLEDYAGYYEAWGETWERLALLKARPVAGDPGTGLKFLRVVEPFIFRRHLDYTTLSEVRRLKQRVEDELTSLGHRHLKLGIGGIREIEFSVQTLQLLSGAQHPEVKDVNTLRALRKLSSARILDEAGAHDLSDAYAFLRKAEHRLQMFLDRQLHTLPHDYGEMRRLALRMGYLTEEAFEADLGRHTSRVREIFNTILPPPKKEEEPGLAVGGLPPSLTDRALTVHGMKDPEAARKALHSLRSSLRADGRVAFDSLIPTLLRTVSGVANPDLAVARFERFLSSTGAQGAYLSVLTRNPKAIELLLSVLGGSEFLSRLLIANPPLFDSLVSSGSLKGTKSRDEMEGELKAVIASLPEWSGKRDALRRFKAAEVLRIGTRDLLGLTTNEAVSSELSDLADACLDAALVCAWDEAAASHGQPLPGTHFVLLGLGKLGGRELNYGSDLDLLALYSREGTTTGVRRPVAHYLFFSSLMEKLLDILGRQTAEGTAYTVDLRLRPMGEKGALAQTSDSLIHYLSTVSRPWERLAYTRVRPAAGDKDFGRQAVGEIHSVIASRPPDPRDVHEVREKMIDERLDRESRAANVKLAPGGIVDIEFIIQFLILRHGGTDPALMKSGTLDALAALSQAGRLTHAEEAALRAAYDFFRRVEMRLRIVQDRPLDALPSDHASLNDLAVRLGLRSGEELKKGISSHMASVRDIYTRIINPPHP